LSILSPAIEDCYELSFFIRYYKLKYSKPLLAVGMEQNGQVSRITSPISLVTHPLIPYPSTPGQLSLAQVHQARHLIGQLPKQEISVVGEEAVTEKISRALQAAFLELGYPHLCMVWKGKKWVYKFGTWRNWSGLYFLYGCYGYGSCWGVHAMHREAGAFISNWKLSSVDSSSYLYIIKAHSKGRFWFSGVPTVNGSCKLLWVWIYARSAPLRSTQRKNSAFF
jgi:hypothetical protein